MSYYRTRGKRYLDLLLTVLTFMLLLPLLGVAALAVRLSSPGPVFFSQVRMGRGGQPFRTYKFRSMFVNDADPRQMGHVGGSHELVTPVGRIIRRLKIDELPQLWNVLRGEMSIVGPRPTLPEQAAEYAAEQKRRLDVLPGLTGWAQVNGNIELSWDERIRLDLFYVEHQSFWFDMKTIWLTLDVIVRGEHPRVEALRAAGISRSS